MCIRDRYLAALAPALFFGLLGMFRALLKEQDSDDHKKLLNWLHENASLPFFERVRHYLKGGLNWADRFFEYSPHETHLTPHHWSAKSLDRCLLLAVLYPFVSAMVSWFLFGQAGALGDALGFPENNNLLYRAGSFIGLAIALYCYWKFQKSAGWISILLLSLIHI